MSLKVVKGCLGAVHSSRSLRECTRDDDGAIDPPPLVPVADFPTLAYVTHGAEPRHFLKFDSLAGCRFVFRG
jgi:hypothetical protein